MKRVLLFVVLVASCIVANAQWSIGADVRIAPFGRYGEDHHVGSDIVVNYSVDMPLDFYIMPTIGVFIGAIILRSRWREVTTVTMTAIIWD